MNIVNATKAALKKNCAMTYPKAREFHVVVVPERGLDANYFALVDTRTKKQIGRRWAPDIHDILSEEWTIVEKPRSKNNGHS